MLDSTSTGPDGRYSLFLNMAGTVTVTGAADPHFLPESVDIEVDADRMLDIRLFHTGKPPSYARDHPDREDIAESFMAYLAVRHDPANR